MGKGSEKVKNTTMVIPSINVPMHAVPNFAVKCQEKISFRHDYNSRVDPNEPPRGKVTPPTFNVSSLFSLSWCVSIIQLHGNFVWGKVANQDDHHQNS